MRLIKHTFIFLILLLSASVNAAEILGVEVKEVDNMDVIIFYHPKNFKIELSYSGGRIKVRSDEQIKFRKLTPVSIDHIMNELRNENSKTIVGTTKEKYANFEIIRGEKLTAIKFKTENKHVKFTDKIQAANRIDRKTPEVTSDKNAILSGFKTAINVKKRKDLIEIQFNFPSPVSSAAFQRYGKLWIAFDQKQSFAFPHVGDIAPPTFIDHPEATILSFDIPKGLEPELTSRGDGWLLRFKKQPEILTTKYTTEKLIGEYGIHVDASNLQKIISFQDPDIGDTISLATTTKELSGLDEPIYFNNFTLYNSLLGVAIESNGEELKTKLTETGIAIAYNYSAVSPVDTEIKSDKNTDLGKTYLPVRSNTQPTLDFTTRKAMMFKEAANADTILAKDKMLDIAKFYFEEGEYPEVLGALKLIDFDKDFTAKNPDALLLKAVTLSLVSRNLEADDVFLELEKLDVSQAFKIESSIWHNYNNYKLDQRNDSLGITDYIDKFIDRYPDYLYWELVGAEFEITALANELPIAENLFRKIRAPITSHDVNLLNYSKATFYRKNKRYNLASNYYDAIKIKGLDAKYYVRGEFDRINMFIDLKEIDINEALAKLEAMNFLWRGDNIEYNLLLKEAQLYQFTRNYLKALRGYKYIFDVFPNDRRSVQISNQMADIYNNYIFDKSGYYKNITDFDLVALYYEFKDLTPIGEDGDRIVLEVAKRMIKLDLLQQAEEILDHQVKYRLGGKEKIITGDHLATVYILDRKPQLAIDVLNDTDIINSGFAEHLARQRLKAKAYIDLGDYNSALLILKSDDSVDAKIIKEEAYFKLLDWDNFAILAESSLLPIITANKKIPENEEKEALRLAISYSMLGKEDELAYLTNSVKTDNKTLEDAIRSLAISNEKIDIQKLEVNFKIEEFDKHFKSIVDKLFNFS